VANLDEHLASVLSTLEECRTALTDGDPETASLISVVILELQTKLNRISEPELKALCDAMSSAQTPGKVLAELPQRRPPLLRLVK
jgi:hypothetical protein